MKFDNELEVLSQICKIYVDRKRIIGAVKLLDYKIVGSGINRIVVKSKIKNHVIKLDLNDNSISNKKEYKKWEKISKLPPQLRRHFAKIICKSKDYRAVKYEFLIHKKVNNKTDLDIGEVLNEIYQYDIDLSDIHEDNIMFRGNIPVISDYE